MAEFFEILMIVSFGVSWPASVLKSYKARTTQGKSLFFLYMILGGYVCGITSKLLSQSYKWYVLFFYILNLVIVSLDLILYYRNRKIEKTEKTNA